MAAPAACSTAITVTSAWSALRWARAGPLVVTDAAVEPAVAVVVDPGGVEAAVAVAVGARLVDQSVAVQVVADELGPPVAVAVHDDVDTAVGAAHHGVPVPAAVTVGVDAGAVVVDRCAPGGGGCVRVRRAEARRLTEAVGPARRGRDAEQ